MGRIVGIKAISNYLGFSESTVMDMIQNQGMPATKDTEQNIWEVDQSRLDRWKADPQRDAKMAAVSEQAAEKDTAEAEKSEPQTEPETEPETPIETEPKFGGSKKKRRK